MKLVLYVSGPSNMAPNKSDPLAQHPDRVYPPFVGLKTQVDGVWYGCVLELGELRSAGLVNALTLNEFGQFDLELKPLVEGVIGPNCD